MTKQYLITVTEKQLEIIGIACEIYGCVLLGQIIDIFGAMPLKEEYSKFDVYYDLNKFLQEYLDEHNRNQHNASIAFDIWRNIIRKDNLTLSTEPAVKIINQTNNGWISVDDELPTNGSVCFVLREKIDVSKFPSYIPVPIHFMNSYYCRVDKTIYKDDHFTCDENSREKVTHWVLAPEEPQE